MPNTLDYQHAETITPADATDISDGCVGVEVITTTGNVAVRFAQQAKDGTDVDATFYIEKGDGRMFPGGIKRVLSTGTTAVGILGLYRQRLDS